jgi:hypothetical protein
VVLGFILGRHLFLELGKDITEEQGRLGQMAVAAAAGHQRQAGTERLQIQEMVGLERHLLYRVPVLLMLAEVVVVRKAEQQAQEGLVAVEVEQLTTPLLQQEQQTPAVEEVVVDMLASQEGQVEMAAPVS